MQANEPPQKSVHLEAEIHADLSALAKKHGISLRRATQLLLRKGIEKVSRGDWAIGEVTEKTAA